MVNDRVVHHFSSLDSTNRYALDLALRGATPGTLILADYQTRGRGRHDRTFCSPPGGLYFSLILQPTLNIGERPLISLAAGIGCCLALEATAPIDVFLKWPNDLFADNRKLGGILVECPAVPASAQNCTVIVGVGINVNSVPEDFPSEIRVTLTTLKTLTGETYDISRLGQAMADEIEQMVNLLIIDRPALLARWQERDYLLGKSVRVRLEERMEDAIGSGLARDGSGSYCLKKLDGTLKKILAGDILLTPENGTLHAFQEGET